MSCVKEDKMSEMGEKCIIFVKCIEGIDDFQLKMTMDTPINTVKERIREQLPSAVIPRVSISSMGGISINPYKTVNELYHGITYRQSEDITKFLNLKINICLCGGKGGFGQLLKARAHTMNKKNRRNLKSSSKDMYKTLDGRRVKTIKKIKQLDEYMSTVDDAERAKIAEKRAKLQKLLDVDLNKNVKFEDNEFLEDLDRQLEEIRESVNYIASSSSDEDMSEDEDGSSEDQSEEEVAGQISARSSISNRRSQFLNFFEEDDEDDDERKDANNDTKPTSKPKGKEIDI